MINLSISFCFLKILILTMLVYKCITVYRICPKMNYPMFARLMLKSKSSNLYLVTLAFLTLLCTTATTTAIPNLIVQQLQQH